MYKNSTYRYDLNDFFFLNSYKLFNPNRKGFKTNSIVKSKKIHNNTYYINKLTNFKSYNTVLQYSRLLRCIGCS